MGSQNESPHKLATSKRRKLDDSDSETSQEETQKTDPPPTRAIVSGQECPYLDTINRQFLDFDFEKCCSVSLRQENVYVCLVCGKYFQVRLHLLSPQGGVF